MGRLVVVVLELVVQEAAGLMVLVLMQAMVAVVFVYWDKAQTVQEALIPVLAAVAGLGVLRAVVVATLPEEVMEEL